MQHIITVLFVMLFSSLAVQANEIAVSVNKLTDSGVGVGNSIGVIVAKDGPDGLVLQPYLQGLKPGEYGFSVNENVGCGVEFNADGNSVPGMAAGKSLSSLPMLEVNQQGHANQAMIAQNLTLEQIRGRTLVVTDIERQLRVACGSLELYGLDG
jgi:Cu/Zn superoxide dismutase